MKTPPSKGKMQSLEESCRKSHSEEVGLSAQPCARAHLWSSPEGLHSSAPAPIYKSSVRKHCTARERSDA